MFKLVYLFIFFVCVGVTAFSHEKIFEHLDDYKTHPCIRDCSESKIQMQCNYKFVVEWYTVLSKACLNCPKNSTDCFRKDCISADGFKKAVVSVNRLIPGPTIQVCQNDIINVIVHNNLRDGEAITIHWHGILQKGTPYMDGVGMVTQCPILPHTSFQYKFVALNAGTHWWHAHFGIQRLDGIFGAIIVKKSVDAQSNEYDFDLNEHVILLNDLFHDTVASKFAFFFHENASRGRADSILINGRGMQLNNSIDNIETPRSVFKVKQGKRYRFRLIHAGAIFCPIQFMIDGHNLRVITSDGDPFNAIDVEAVVLHVGERYDVVVSATQDVDNYWIIAKGLGLCKSKQLYQTAILSYESASNEITTGGNFNYSTLTVEGKQLNNADFGNNSESNGKFIQVSDLRALIDEKEKLEFYERIKQTPDKKFYFGLAATKLNNPESNNPILYPSKLTFPFFTPQVNKISYEMPPSPPLTQFEDLPKDMICNETNIENICPSRETKFCSCIHMISVNFNDLIEFIYVDETVTAFQAIHPMHIHGHKFAVLAIEKLNDNNSSITVERIKQLDSEKKLKRNFDRPPLKDTIITLNGGYTIIRFIADNPGVWIVHCHIEFHMEVGMTFLIKSGETNQFPTPPKNWPRCGNFFL